MALCICTGTYGAASGPKGRTRRRCEEPQWRAGCESDSAFRRGKEGAGTHYARQLDRAAGVADEWRVAAGPGRLAGRLRAACCVPCLREMSRQRARGGACGCMWPRVRRTCGICPAGPCFLGAQANTSRALEISQDATQRDLDLFTYAHQRVAPLFPPCC